MKNVLLLTAIAAGIFFISNDSLEAKSHVSFGINVNSPAYPQPVYYAPQPVVVRRASPVVVAQPTYQEHVVVGQGSRPPVVVYSAPVIREEVVVYPARPAPRWYNFFSFNWRFCK